MATIQGVYVALFGRPADPAGLAYFNGVTNNGQNLAAINNLAGQPEYTKRFENMNNAQIVNSIYQSLFGRDAEAAGLNFFVEALNNGTLNINNIAIAILDGAQGNDAVVRDAKIASADLFTAALDTPLKVAAYTGQAASDAGAAFLSGITTTPKTAADAEAAVETLVTESNLGNTIDLGGLTEVVVGNVGDAGVSTNRNDTINAAAAGDWVDSQAINGGFGVDTLNATLAADLTVEDGATGNGSLRNVEILNITADGADVTLDLEEAVGVQQVWNVDSDDGLTVQGIAANVTVGLRGAVVGAAEFIFDDVDGDDDAVTVALDEATTSAGVTIDGVETLTLSVADSANIDSLEGDAISSITVSGGGDLTIDLSAVTTLESFVGGAGVEVVTIDAGVLTEALVIDLAAGNDTITLDLTGAVSATVDVAGGAGSDLFELGVLANIASADEDEFAESLVTITDFNAAQDVIAVGLSGTDASFNNVQLANIRDADTLFEAVGIVAGIAGASNNAIFVYGGDTYLFQNNLGADFDAGDGLVKITGLTDLELLTDANFI